MARRARAWSAGNDRETMVKKVLEGEGWVVGSRRHYPGPGDLLAVRPLPEHFTEARHEVWLIEVKATADKPWRSTWGPEERQALIDLAAEHGAEPWLAWWPPRKELLWLPPSDWPASNLPITTTA